MVCVWGGGAGGVEVPPTLEGGGRCALLGCAGGTVAVAVPGVPRIWCVEVFGDRQRGCRAPASDGCGVRGQGIWGCQRAWEVCDTRMMHVFARLFHFHL
jgi:hypothetical protein